MLKRFTSLALAALLLQVAYVPPAAAKPRAEREAQFVEKLKAGLTKLGTGPAGARRSQAA